MPFCTFQDETSHITTIFGVLLNVSNRAVSYDEVEFKLVNRDNVGTERFSAESLQQGSRKALRVSERRYVVDEGQTSADPFSEEIHAPNQIFKPARETLKREVVCTPSWRHSILLHKRHDNFEFWGDDFKSLNTSVELGEATTDSSKQFVVSLHFL